MLQNLPGTVLQFAPKTSKKIKSLKLYLAGPMTNLPEFNFPEFNRVAKELREQGYFVLNPAEKDGEVVENSSGYKTGDSHKAIKDGFDFREAYLWDVMAVIQSDGIYMLTDWEQSAGARGEHAVAVAMKRHFPDYKIMYQGLA